MRKLCDVDEVRKCLDEVTGDDSVYAKGLLEWAIRKRTVDEAEVRADERRKVLGEAYDVLADKLIWVLENYGGDTYIEISQSIKEGFAEVMKGEQT